jgi:hypothetical protein
MPVIIGFYIQQNINDAICRQCSPACPVNSCMQHYCSLSPRSKKWRNIESTVCKSIVAVNLFDTIAPAIYLILITLTGRYSTWRPMHCYHILMNCASVSELIIIIPELSGCSRYTEQRNTELARNVIKFSRRNVSCHTPQGFLTWRKTLRYRADGFLSVLRE